MSIKSWSMLLIGLLSISSFAQSKDALNCHSEAVRFKNALVRLNADAKANEHRVYILKNISSEAIWLNHPQSQDAHANAGWASEIKPGNASSLLLSKRNFSLNCSRLNNGHPQFFECKKVIEVCEATLSAPSSTASSYWLIENVPTNEIMAATLKRIRSSAKAYPG